MGEYDEDAEAVSAIAWLLATLTVIGLMIATYRTLRKPSDSS